MKKKINNLIKIFLYYFDLLSLKFFSTDKEEKKDVVLVRTDGIGDFILWINSAERLRDFYKGEIITLVTTNENKELAKLINYFDEIICIDRKKFNQNLIYRFKYVRLLSKIRAKTLINPIVSHSSLSEAIVLAIKGNEKITIESIQNSNLPNYLEKVILKNYNKLITIPENLEHEIEKNFFFINQIIKEDKDIYLSNKCFEKIEPYKKTIGKYCIFFIGASNIGKCWPTSNFIELGNSLLKQDKTIILCGGEKEKKLGEKFLEKISNKERVKNMIGKTKMIEVISLLKGAEIIVSNDTFSGHLAKLLDKKLILILGGGNYGRFFPYPKILQTKEKIMLKKMNCFGCNWKCNYKDIPYKCIRKICSNKVIEEVRLLIKTE